MVVGKNKGLNKAGKKGGKKKIVNPFSKKSGMMSKLQLNSRLGRLEKRRSIVQAERRSPQTV